MRLDMAGSVTCLLIVGRRTCAVKPVFPSFLGRKLYFMNNYIYGWGIVFCFHDHEGKRGYDRCTGTGMCVYYYFLIVSSMPVRCDGRQKLENKI